MKKHTGFGIVLAATVALFATATPAFATVQTINLDTVYTGFTPDGTSPWLKATFTYDGSSNVGTLDLTANLGPDFVGRNGFNGLAFYLSGNTLNSAAYVSGTAASVVNIGAFTAPGALGAYNLQFWWNANAFNGTDTARYTLSFANMLTASPFVANAEDWLAYAHIQGITNTAGGQTCSGWIVSGTGTPNTDGLEGTCGGTPPPTNVPEPGALGMFGLGVLLLGGFLGWRRRYA